MIYGPTEASFGSNVSINCTVLMGQPPLSVYIITPQKEIINDIVISFNATMKDAGNYTCVANNSVSTVTITHSLFVYGMFYIRTYLQVTIMV